MSHVPDEELDPQLDPDVEAVRQISTLALKTLNGLVDDQFGSVYDVNLPDIVATCYSLPNGIISIERETSFDPRGTVESDELSFLLTTNAERGAGTTCVSIDTTEIIDNDDPRYDLVATTLVVETDSDSYIEDLDVQVALVKAVLEGLQVASEDLGGWRAITPSLSNIEEPIEDAVSTDTILTLADLLDEIRVSMFDASLDQYHQPVNIDPRLKKIFISFLASVALYRLGASSEYTQSLEVTGKVLAGVTAIYGLYVFMKQNFDHKHAIPKNET